MNEYSRAAVILDQFRATYYVPLQVRERLALELEAMVRDLIIERDWWQERAVALARASVNGHVHEPPPDAPPTTQLPLEMP